MQHTTTLTDPFATYVTRDPFVLRTLALLRGWARTRADVLVEGESGVGKSLVARLLHLSSLHPQAALVVFPPTELPGVARPWATPARNDTVVIDALESWPIRRQEQLLRHVVRPGGARLVALTRVSLARLRNEGRLHEGLGRRFGHRMARLPPLRARPDDIAPIVAGMLRRAGRSDVTFEPGAWSALAEHAWSDNVRELRQVIEGALTRLRGDRLEVGHLPLDPHGPPSLEALVGGTFAEMRNAVDGWYLRRIVREADGNLSEAARRADSSRKVLRDRLRRLGLYPLSIFMGGEDSADEDSVAREGSRVEPRAWVATARPGAHQVGSGRQHLAVVREVREPLPRPGASAAA